MSDDHLTQRLNAEGADLLTLAGVNDSNLIALSRITGVRVSLRGDSLSLTGPGDAVERATPVAQRMLDTARQQLTLTPDDVQRLSEDPGDNGNGGMPGEMRIALPGVRRIIQPKTSGQAEYMKLIADNDIADDYTLGSCSGGKSGVLGLGALSPLSVLVLGFLSILGGKKKRRVV